MKVTQQVEITDSNFYKTQYILDDGSYILVSDKWGNDYFQHGKNVPGKNHRVRLAMKEALQRFLKNQAA